ncbi:LAGLIDADG family homing endonuclease [Candidatus Woesearchaeota archaeon]|nr:LAGLIDADG family homing endonuclease [Candidatus Woesearchaeota archaeon]
MLSADNQQERLDPNWITGFVDGEGCFYVGINQHNRTKQWQLLPEFRIVQHQRDEQVLHRIQKFFGFGAVTVNHGDRKEFRVRGLENLNKIVEFFNQNKFQTRSKQKSFEVFSCIIKMMNNKEHLSEAGRKKIANLIATVNKKVIPKYLISSETVRQNLARDKIQSDPLSD